jgi:hypothetical protein
VSEEWVQEALHLVEEVGEHFAAEEGGEKVGFVTLNDGGMFVPKVIAIEEDMIDHVSVTTVRTCGVVASIRYKAR